MRSLPMFVSIQTEAFFFKTLENVIQDIIFVRILEVMMELYLLPILFQESLQGFPDFPLVIPPGISLVNALGTQKVIPSGFIQEPQTSSNGKTLGFFSAILARIPPKIA